MSNRLVSYRHTLVNSIGTFFSRISGVLKQLVVNHLFGAGADPFWAAFIIPNSLRRYFGEGALSNSFIPVFQKMLSSDDPKDKEAASRFASNILNIFLLVTIGVTIIGAVFAPFYIPLLGKGFDQANSELTILLTVIMMPFLVFIYLYAMGMGILNSHKKFTTPAFAPLLFNAIFILAPLLLYEQMGIFSLAIGVLVGGLSMFLIELFELSKIGLKYRLFIDLRDPNLRNFFRLFIPTTVNMLALTGKDFLSFFFKSFYAGAFTVMMNALIIIEAPLGIVGIAIGTVLLPLLSQFSAQKDNERFEKSLLEGFSMLSYLILPLSFYFIFYSDTIVHTLLRDTMRIVAGNTGKFTPQLVHETIRATSLYALALFPMSSIYLFERIFYSVHDAKTPLKANLITIAVCLTLYTVSFYSTAFIQKAILWLSAFIPSDIFQNIGNIGIAGIVFAEMVSSWVVFFYYILFKLGQIIRIREIIQSLAKRFVALFLIAGLSAVVILPFHIWITLKAESAWLSLLFGGLEFAIFAGLYFVLTLIFKLGLKR